MIQCVICQDRGAGHRYACDPCRDTMRRRLREIETYAAVLTLPASLELPRGATGRRKPGYGSGSPARLDVLVMTDRRSRTEHSGEDPAGADPWGFWPILGILQGLGQFVRGRFGEPTPRTTSVTSEVAYLLSQVDRAAMERWVVDVDADVRELHAQVRRVARDEPPRPIGMCPNQLKTGDCGAPLFVPLHSDTVRCRACGRAWSRDEWLNLAMLITNANPRNHDGRHSAG